jgi:hypothetical protein
MKYQTYTLPNGLRVILLPSASPVVYCGYQMMREPVMNSRGKKVSHISASTYLSRVQNAGRPATSSTDLTVSAAT